MPSLQLPPQCHQQTTMTVAGMSRPVLVRFITKHIPALQHAYQWPLPQSIQPSKVTTTNTISPPPMMFPSICSALTSSLRRKLLLSRPERLHASSYQTLIDTCIIENVLRYVAGDWSHGLLQT